MRNIETETVEKSQSNPRIILLGWLGSQMKYLNKYSKLWNDMNCTTMNVIDAKSVVSQCKDLYLQGRRVEISEFILEQLLKDESSRPLIFHVFSNGGAIIYPELIKEILKYNSTIVENPIKVAGVIFDSSPSRPKFLTAVKTFAFLTPFFLRFLVYFIMIFLWIPSLYISTFTKTHYDKILELDTKFPQLFIYSTGDEIVNYEDVEELMEKRRKMNEVFVQKFGSDSPHVAHLRHNKSKYIEALYSFLKKVENKNA